MKDEEAIEVVWVKEHGSWHHSLSSGEKRSELRYRNRGILEAE